MDDAAIGRRVAAARKRAGIHTRKELTDAAELPRVGPATLGKIERGERHLFPHEADVFARVLGVDRSFFFEGDAEEPDLTERLDRIEQALAALNQRENTASQEREGIRSLLAQQSQILADISALLERQDQILAEMGRVAGRFPDNEALAIFNEGARQIAAAAEAYEAAPGGQPEGQAGTRRRGAGG